MFNDGEILRIAKQPIRNLRGVDGWKEIRINEERANDRLVNLNDLPESRRVLVVPMYYEQGIEAAEPDQFLRQSAVEGLTKVTEVLPRDWKLVVWDAYRPLLVQESLFTMYYQRLRRAHPTMSQADLTKMAQKFVSLPSENAGRPSPHVTGVAVDVTLMRKGEYLWMGTEFDDFTDLARADYFEKSENVKSKKDEEARGNRRILHYLMTQVGKFSQYVDEWWHFDRGNQFNAASLGLNSARFGIIDRKNKV